MAKKITWNDLKDGIAVAKKYNMNLRQTEAAIKKHLDGANASERRQVYQEFFTKRK